MGIFGPKRKKIGGTTFTVSKRGVTASRKAGPFTVNSKGKVTLRLGKRKSIKF